MKSGERVEVRVPGNRKSRFGTVISPVASQKSPHCSTVKIDGVKQPRTIHWNYLHPAPESDNA